MPTKTAAPSYLNTAITTWTGPLGLPDFASIEDRDFEAAFAAALPAHLAEVEAIANTPKEPTFENTIVALETAGDLLTRASGIFWNIAPPLYLVRAGSGCIAAGNDGIFIAKRQGVSRKQRLDFSACDRRIS